MSLIGCPHTEEAHMNLPSRLIKSRHGVFYYRLQFQIENKRKELRISLLTKDPVVAKNKSFQISAIIISNRSRNNCMAKNFAPDDFSSLSGIEINNHLKKLDIVHPNGVAFNNINTENDLQLFFKAAEAMQLKFPKNKPALNASATTSPTTTTLTTASSPTTSASSIDLKITVNEVIKMYATSVTEKIGDKTQYEWANYHKKFAEWIGTYKKNTNFPMSQITKGDIGYYIHDLRSRQHFDIETQSMVRKIKDRTIQHKYLASLGTLFEYAQNIFAYPKVEIPTIGHGVFTKKDYKKTVYKSKYKPFTENELSIIFNPNSFLKQQRPADFWLPLLAIFTGCRIAELCQLTLTDITKIAEIWTISINDDENKKIKTEASRRIIPVHPILIKLGFLEYIEDAKSYGGMLFPYLTANKFGNYSETPSERFGKYLDSLNIKDPKKVFHSFRGTVNSRFKDLGVHEGTRCQVMGHEYETTNDTNYTEPHSLQYIYEILINNLNFNDIDFEKLRYHKGRFSVDLKHLCKLKVQRNSHKNARLAKKLVK